MRLGGCHQSRLPHHLCGTTPTRSRVRRGSQLGLPSEGLTWPLCPMVAMGTVPVLQEAGRAVSCFEEGLRAVFLQSACPKRGRKPRAGPPLLLGVWWSHAHTQPARRGCCGNTASGESQTGQQKEKKWLAGRGWSLPPQTLDPTQW